MPHIHKTKAMATTAGAAFPFCFIDPTGTSQVVFLTASISAGTGITIHAGQCIWRRIKKFRSFEKHEEVKTVAQLSAGDALQPATFDQRAFEECIRKLASSMTGLAVSSTLSVVLPHYVFAFLLNGGEVAYQLHKLRKMRDICGGTKQLMEKVSKFDMALQVSAGVCIKFLTTMLFLGAADFDMFVDTIAHASDALMISTGDGAVFGTAGSAAEAADALKAAHDSLLDHGVFSNSTAVAGAPTEAMSQLMGDGAGHTPTWTDNTPTSHWAATGVVGTIAETGLARLVEEPIHKAINGAATAGEKFASSKYGHEKQKRKGSDHLPTPKKRFSVFRRSPSPLATLIQESSLEKRTQSATPALRSSHNHALSPPKSAK
jgi:hypothetical protein